MKLNNRGFAITTVLYGTLILFLMLLTSMLGILSTHKVRMEKLIEEEHGARDIIESGPESSDPSSSGSSSSISYYYQWYVECHCRDALAASERKTVYYYSGLEFASDSDASNDCNNRSLSSYCTNKCGDIGYGWGSEGGSLCHTQRKQR